MRVGDLKCWVYTVGRQKLATPFFSEKSYHFQSSSTSFSEYPLLNRSFLKDSLVFSPNNDSHLDIDYKTKINVLYPKSRL